MTPSIEGLEDYRLVMADEFDQESLDDNLWRLRFGDDLERGAGFIAATSVQFLGDGYLHLVTEYEDNRLLTAMIRTQEVYGFGYYEARIKFQTLRGHHGAFWMQSPAYLEHENDPAHSGAEIDIIEFFGTERANHDTEHNVYWNGEGGRSGENHPTHEISYINTYGEDLSDSFHTFGLLWTPDQYVFFIDGNETYRTSEGVSHVSEFVILSLESSTSENEHLDLTQLPDEMLVDYVRIFTP